MFGDVDEGDARHSCVPSFGSCNKRLGIGSFKDPSAIRSLPRRHPNHQTVLEISA